ncbi:MAG: hypothetical protein WBB34_05795 [Xanthobacteraceae bacterium]
MRNLPLAAKLSIPAFTLSIALASTGALAQSVGPNEAVSPDGTVGDALTLTPIQESALYHAVLQQRMRTTTAWIDPTIGAPVSAAVQLSDLPGQSGIQGAIDDEAVLKYAMVQGDLVVVDPIQMRVIDIIHGSTRP